MKHLCLLIAFLSFLSCKAQEDNEDLAKEVIISGRVLNREVYPKEKEVTLVIPYLSEMETVYTSPIADDGTFTFRFSPYAPVREVVLRNYAEHLFVHPGDSLFVEIDFSNLLSPKITGTSGTLNQYMEHTSRWERRADFLKEHSPGAEVEEYTADLLWIDYYNALFNYATSQASQGYDVSLYMALMLKLNPLFSGKTVFAGLFPLAETVNFFLYCNHTRREYSNFELADLVEDCKDNAILPYLYLQHVAVPLCHNDTLCLADYRLQFDSIVQAPHLRQPILELYEDGHAVYDSRI